MNADLTTAILALLSKGLPHRAAEIIIHCLLSGAIKINIADLAKALGIPQGPLLLGVAICVQQNLARKKDGNFELTCPNLLGLLQVGPTATKL